MSGMVVGMRWIPAVAVLLCMGSIASGDEEGDGRRIRLGGMSVTGVYVSGPGFWSPWYWGPAPWGSYWYPGLAHPGPRYGFPLRSATGEVKLAGAPKNALVFVNGGFAGFVSNLKHMRLEPGA